MTFHQETVPKRKKRKLIQDVSEMEITLMRVDDGMNRLVFMGIGGGRAKIVCAAIDYGDGQYSTTKTFTRHQHYHNLGHRRRVKETNRRVDENPPLKNAIEATPGGKDV